MGAAVLKADEISIGLDVSHLSVGGHVDEGEVRREVPKDFGAVVVKALERDGLIVEVGLGVVWEFEDHRLSGEWIDKI